MPTMFSNAPGRARGRKALLGSLFAMACLPMSISSAFATPFLIDTAVTTAQTLGSGAGQAGSVTSTGSLIVNGSAIAVTITGNNATLNNQGTISQTGGGRAVRDNTGVTGLMITNGSITNANAVMQTAGDDVVQMNKAGGSVTVNNYGKMTATQGGQVLDFNAITTGANVVNNFAGGVITSNEADAVRPGVNGVVNNAGTIQAITTKGDSSDGVDAQSNTGIQINNAATGVIDGGRHGITGGAANASTRFDISVTNEAGGVIRGSNGSGMNLDGFNANQTATIVNRGTITGNGVTGDGDGIDVDGLATITNTGTIRSINAFSAPASGKAFSEGISFGGGTITNSGTIEGLVAAGNTNALGRGITLAGVDIASGPLAGTREGLYANTVVTNQAGGMVRGQTDSAIVVVGAASGFTVTINNNAGATLMGGGTANAAIKTGLDNDTIRNAGVINGASSGMAIDMGGGNNTLYISGGQASILGSINGGSGGTNKMIMTPGAGNTFAFADSIANFGSVEVQSGTVRLSGASTYSGLTEVSGGTLMLDGVNRLASASGLVMKGGTLQLANAAGQNGQTFSSFSLLEDSILDLGFSSLTFNGLDSIARGKTFSLLNFLDNGALDYAFRLLGDFSGNADFLALMDNTFIDGARVSFRFDGTYTDVSRIAAQVPEPGTIALLLLSLVLMGALYRRSKQSPR